VKQYIT